jgi:AcrR family transcriptional regulator
MPDPPGTRSGLRERKKQQTRDALTLAAIRLATEHGWSRVTIEDIAAEANVSVRTFRNYFPGKADVIAARHLDRMRRIADELRARPAAEPLWEAVASAVRAQFAPGHEADREQAPDRKRLDAIRLMLAEPSIHGAVLKANAVAEAELAEAVAERTGTDTRSEVHPKLVAAAVGGATTVAMEHWLRADPPVPFGPLLDEVFAQLAAGLPVPARTEEGPHR